MERYQEIERSIITNYRNKIWAKFIKGITEYKMIQEGDKIAVCMSGGKDSMLLAKCVQQLHKYSKVNFDAQYIAMNPGYSETNKLINFTSDKTIYCGDIVDVEITDAKTWSLDGRVQ